MNSQQTPQTRAEARGLRAAAQQRQWGRARGAAVVLSVLATLGLVIPPAAIASATVTNPVAGKTLEFRHGTMSDPSADDGTDLDVHDAPPTDAPVTDAPVTDTPVTDTPVTDTPSTDPTVTPSETPAGEGADAPADIPPAPPTQKIPPTAGDPPVVDATWTRKPVSPNGVSPMALPPRPSGYARIVVTVGGDRLANGGVKGLPGVTLQLYRGDAITTPNGSGVTLNQGALRAPYTQSWATCVSDADGHCSFVVPVGWFSEVTPGTRFWVVAKSAPTGWYLNETVRIGGHSAKNDQGANTDKAWQYRFRTDGISANNDYYSTTAMTLLADRNDPNRGFMRNRPDSNAEGGYNENVTRSTGVWSVSRVNPPLSTACAIDIALIADTSGSLGPEGIIALKSTMGAFVDAFRGTGAEMSLFSFSNISPGDGATNHPDLLPVGTSAQAAAFKNQYSTWNFGGGTSWDRGFAEAANATPRYDLAILLTDGNPTTYRNNEGAGSSAYNSLQDIDAGIFSANQLKEQGTRVLALGVGQELTSIGVNNLRAVSGTTFGDDYATSSNWNDLVTKLRAIATQNCNGSIAVQKMIVPPGGTTADAVPAPAGWQFDASTTASGVEITPPASQTTDSSGQIDFGLKFSASPASGAVSIVETQQPGYTLVPVAGKNAVCVNAETRTPVTVTNINNATKPGMTVTARSGVRIECTVYNQFAPTTISVQKTVPNGRAVAGDQFTLQLNTSTGQPIANATTAGTATGLQPEKVAPTAVQVATTYQIAEVAGTAHTNLDSYLTSLTCAIDGGAAVPISPGPNNRTASVTVPPAAVGKNISCLFTNTPPTLTLIKDIVERTSASDQFRLDVSSTGTNPASMGSVTTTGTTTGVQGAQVGPLNVGVGNVYTVSEVAAATTDFDSYDSALECRVDGGAVFVTNVGTTGQVTIPADAAGKNVTCTFTNTAHPDGSVIWKKVTNTHTIGDPNYEPLSGAEFMIVGPAPSTTEIVVVDCVASAAAGCASEHDTDHRAGFFSVRDLPWGDYQLIETKAPAGYMLDATPRPFTIGVTAPAQLDWDLGLIENDQIDVPVIPLTGGASEDAFMIGAGALGALTIITILVQFVRSRDRRESVLATA